MPPAVAAAGVTAAGAVVGGVVASGANKRATQAQAQANRDALTFQREQLAAEQAERAAIRAEQQRRYDAWVSARNAILRKRGIDIGGGAAAAAPAYEVPGRSPNGGAPSAPPSSAPAPSIPGADYGGGRGGASMAPPPLIAAPAPDPLEESPESPDVFDWRNYGVR